MRIKKTHHVNSLDGSEEGIGVNGLGQLGQKLSQLNKIQLQEFFLEEGKDSQGGAKEKFVAVTKKNVPNATCDVEWQRL